MFAKTSKQKCKIFLGTYEIGALDVFTWCWPTIIISLKKTEKKTRKKHLTVVLVYDGIFIHKINPLAITTAATGVHATITNYMYMYMYP